ncbi:MAG: rhomboid family intramembrane serine protease [Bacteroidetes bacterium]|nr:rhomboid family intramembrane serine protease [Bacteroidota bacterium]
MFRLTPTVRTLLIINVVIFVLQNIAPVFTGYLSLWPFGHPYFEPYQFFTYMFAHGSLSHIFFNMFAFASFAPILEQYWGDKKFLFFYIATGIGAALIYAVVNYFFFPGQGAPMLGASGALYGILMAFGLFFPEMELALLFIPIPIKAKYFVFIVGGLTYFLDRSGTVAHLAHFGGALVGYIIVQYWKSQNRGRY